MLADELRSAYPDQVPTAAGVSVPGIVDDAKGIGVFASNLGWRDAPIRDAVAERLGLPVAFGHDVRAAGVAETRLGAARGRENVLLVVIGTGIAGTIMTDGHVLSSGGFAGEIGHMMSVPAGEPCPCGAIGCLETVASASSIARRYSDRAGVRVRGAREVLQAAQSGDEIAKSVWSDAVDALAQQFARIASLLGPEVILVGGGLAAARDALFVPLRERLEQLLSFQRRPLVIPAALGEDAGLLGTAFAARELKKDESR